MNQEHTERELLELAAKAAGYEVLGPASKWICQGVTEHALLITNGRGGDSVFDPITDDGDALRLAVKLNMSVHIDTVRDHTVVSLYINAPDTSSFHESHYPSCEDPRTAKRDAGAATRRAITRAAAQIGKDTL